MLTVATFENIDVVSSATTLEDSVNYGSGMAAGLEPGTYILKLEANRSYDWNDTYTKKQRSQRATVSCL